jgi:hypothetical protein
MTQIDPTSLIIIALIAALAPTIAALGAIVVSLLNHFKANEIHTLVNSQKDAMVKEIAELKTEIADLKKTAFDATTVKQA